MDSHWEWRPPAETWPSCAVLLAASAAGAAVAAGCRARGDEEGKTTPEM